ALPSHRTPAGTQPHAEVRLVRNIARRGTRDAVRAPVPEPGERVPRRVAIAQTAFCGRSLNSRSSQALARRQSRATVSLDTFKTSAVSSTLKPLKNLNSTTRHFLGSTDPSASRASLSDLISTLRCCPTPSASSKETCGAPPPRFW